MTKPPFKDSDYTEEYLDDLKSIGIRMMKLNKLITKEEAERLEMLPMEEGKVYLKELEEKYSKELEK